MPYVILLLGVFIWRFYVKNDSSNNKAYYVLATNEPTVRLEPTHYKTEFGVVVLTNILVRQE